MTDLFLRVDAQNALFKWYVRNPRSAEAVELEKDRVDGHARMTERIIFKLRCYEEALNNDNNEAMEKHWNDAKTYQEIQQLYYENHPGSPVATRTRSQTA